MRARISSGLLGDVQAEHGHAPVGRLDEPEQRLQHRALAGAVRPEQADRAARELRADALQRAGSSP